MDEPTKEKVLLALEPRVVMAAMHTTTISASITAYSTAVGPSSALTKFTSFLATFRMSILPGLGLCHWSGQLQHGHRTGSASAAVGLGAWGEPLSAADTHYIESRVCRCGGI